MKLEEIIDLRRDGESPASIQLINNLDEFMFKTGMDDHSTCVIHQMFDDLASQIKLMPVAMGKILSAEDVSTEDSNYCAARMADQVKTQVDDLEDYFLSILKAMYSHLRIPDPLLR
ncbi:MAG: hypothetical protein ABNH42_18410 [Marinobacter sp.]